MHRYRVILAKMKNNGKVCYRLAACFNAVSALMLLLFFEPALSFSATSTSSPAVAPAATDTTTGRPATSRVARRAAEVVSVALDVALPLVASAASFASATRWQDGAPRGWDAFWSSSATEVMDVGIRGQSGQTDTNTSTTVSGVTNAQRVAMALESLGPTFVKFGQALSSRPDIVPQSLAAALAKLQDDMEPFDTDVAKETVLEELLQKIAAADENGILDTAERWEYKDNVGVRGATHRRRERDERKLVAGERSPVFRIDETTIRQLVGSLSSKPIAAASVGQCYKGDLPGYGPVAVKVRRPGIEKTVDSDYALLRTIAQLIERIPALPSSTSLAGASSQPKQQDRLVATELVAAIDEFMGRLVEELDYKREEQNARKFASLYLVDQGSAVATMPDVNGKGVIVPEFLPELCTDNVLVMSWVEGTKLTEVAESAGQSSEQIRRENLELIELATQCTLSQLLDTGTLHADPHGESSQFVI